MNNVIKIINGKFAEIVFEWLANFGKHSIKDLS